MNEKLKQEVQEKLTSILETASSTKTTLKDEDLKLILLHSLLEEVQNER